jgi:hypothetical protein
VQLAGHFVELSGAGLNSSSPFRNSDFMTLNRRISLGELLTPLRLQRRVERRTIQSKQCATESKPSLGGTLSPVFHFFSLGANFADQGRWGQHPSQRLALRRVRRNRPKSKAHG